MQKQSSVERLRKRNIFPTCLTISNSTPMIDALRSFYGSILSIVDENRIPCLLVDFIRKSDSNSFNIYKEMFGWCNIRWFIRLRIISSCLYQQNIREKLIYRIMQLILGPKKNYDHLFFYKMYISIPVIFQKIQGRCKQFCTF